MGYDYDDYDYSYSSNNKAKIMIVDDSPLILRNIKNILDAKYTVFLATSGKQALNAIPDKNPDLVLLDYKMPEMDGKDVIEAMHADENMKDIPVIFLTSTSDRNAIHSLLKTKPAGYILKPPDEEKLRETIAEVLKNKKQEAD